jgi:hypothetical protein
MTEEPPREHQHAPPEPLALPGWVPTLIGAILVVMAALAVYTGIRYRNPALANGIIRRRTSARPITNGGAPGESEPGGSLVFPGASADATETVAGRNRAEITGGKEGVTGTMRLSARRGLITNVIPDDAMIYVNGLAIGQAKQFNTMDEVYDFPAPGSYTIRIVAPGFKERQFIVTADENGKFEIARIDAKLDAQ